MALTHERAQAGDSIRFVHRAALWRSFTAVFAHLKEISAWFIFSRTPLRNIRMSCRRTVVLPLDNLRVRVRIHFELLWIVVLATSTVRPTRRYPACCTLSREGRDAVLILLSCV